MRVCVHPPLAICGHVQATHCFGHAGSNNHFLWPYSCSNVSHIRTPYISRYMYAYVRSPFLPISFFLSSSFSFSSFVPAKQSRVQLVFFVGSVQTYVPAQQKSASLEPDKNYSHSIKRKCEDQVQCQL